MSSSVKRVDMPYDVTEITAETPLPFDDESRQLFKQASPLLAGLTDEELAKHIIAVRDEAYKASNPYPCIATFFFVHPAVSTLQHKWYRALRARLNDPQAKLLDFACCVGQDLRYLHQDGVKGHQIVGADLEPKYFELGQRLFADKELAIGREAKFVECDIFNARHRASVMSAGRPGNGGYDVIWIGFFIHLFPFEQHKEVLKYLLSFMSKAPGTCIAGRLAGTAEAQPILRVYPDKSGSWSIDVENASLFLHNEDSLKAVFEDVAPGEWRLEAQVAKRWPPALAMRDLPQMLNFIATRK